MEKRYKNNAFVLQNHGVLFHMEKKNERRTVFGKVSKAGGNGAAGLWEPACMGTWNPFLLHNSLCDQRGRISCGKSEK